MFFSRMADLLLSCRHEGMINTPAEIQNNCCMAERLLIIKSGFIIKEGKVSNIFHPFLGLNEK